MRLTACTALLLAAVATPAAADMCSWNAKPIADKALGYLKTGTTIQEYCKPCNDAKAKKMVVQSTALKQMDATNYQVSVNGTAIDLAYIYVPEQAGSKTYTNLGIALSCDSGIEPDSPKILPPAVVAN